MSKKTGCKKVKQVAMLFLMTVLLMSVFTACGNQKLSEEFDETTVKQAAEDIVSYINEEDIEGFCSVPMSEKMKEATTVESMTDVIEQYIGERGAFVEYKNNVAIGSEDDNGNDCAVVMLVAKYENQTVNYTISFDKDMNMIGFYLK